MAKQLNYQMSYDELRTAFYSVLARVCHKPYIDSGFTLGDLGISSELAFCTELELAMKKYTNRFWRSGFDFRQWFYTWNDKTTVDEMLDKLAWQYGVVKPTKVLMPVRGVVKKYLCTRAAIDDALNVQNKR